MQTNPFVEQRKVCASEASQVPIRDIRVIRGSETIKKFGKKLATR
jgi:hypothetical protein